MRNSVCDTQKEIPGEKQNKKQRASSGGKSECCRGIPDQPMGKRKEKKRKGKIKLVSGNKDRIAVEKARGQMVVYRISFFFLFFPSFFSPSFSCSFQRIGLPSNIQTHNSKCFVYVQIFLGGFLPPFLSLPAGHRINISLPSYDYVCVCVCARGHRRRKASPRECSRLVFRIYRSAPESPSPFLVIFFLLQPFLFSFSFSPISFQRELLLFSFPFLSRLQIINRINPKMITPNE